MKLFRAFLMLAAAPMMSWVFLWIYHPNGDGHGEDRRVILNLHLPFGEGNGGPQLASTVEPWWLGAILGIGLPAIFVAGAMWLISGFFASRSARRRRADASRHP